MGHLKLNEKQVDALVWTGKDVFYRDTETKGFGVKVTQTRKVFFAEARQGGNGDNIRSTIGVCGEMPLKEARLKAEEVLKTIHAGGNPIAERRVRKQQAEFRKEADQLTLGRVFEEYCEDRRALKETTVESYRKVMHRCLEDWLSMPITVITKDMVSKRHKELSQIKRGRGDNKPKDWDGSAQANQLMRILRAVFNFALVKYEDYHVDGKPLLTSNPVDILARTKSWNKQERRQTVIKSCELKQWHDAVMSEVDNEVIRDYLLLLLFAGLRKEEAAGLRWKDVNLRAATFTVRDTKNGEDHTLPITPAIKEIFVRQAAAITNEYVFPGEKHGSTGHIVECRKQTQRITNKTGIEFTFHDLRRTFITIAESLDVQGYTLKRLVNHKTGGDVTAGYIVNDVERLRKPMEKISAYIQDLVDAKSKEGDSVVVPITSGSKKSRKDSG